MAEAEAPVLWPLEAKSRLIGKDPDAGNSLCRSTYQPPFPKQICVFSYIDLRMTSTWENACVASLSVRGGHHP